MPDALRVSKPPRDVRLPDSGTSTTKATLALDAEDGLRSAAGALEALTEVEREMRVLEARKVQLIGLAQQRGASWDEIGSALEVSRQAAWEKYRDRVRELLTVTAARARPEDQTLESAAQVLKEVRARRRRR